MEKLIIWISIVITFLNVVLPVFYRIIGIPLNTLNCGLIGYCGNRPADPNLLRLLMLYNLDRGKDATGWAINNEVHKQTVPVSEFLSTNDLIMSPQHRNFTFIAHTRSSSAGGSKNLDHAHPFGRYAGDVIKNKYDLILAMNGTITNMTEMAEHFKTTYTTFTNSDTQVLSEIMVNLGKDYVKALERYDGAATLLFFSPAFPNSLMVYKDVGRPLFYWQKDRHELYISSMELSLQAIGAPKDAVISFEDRCVSRIKDGVIVEIKKVPVVALPKKTYTYHSNRSQYGYYGGVNHENRFQNFSHQSSDYSSTNLNRITEDVVARLQNKTKKQNAIYWAIDRYRINGTVLNGEYHLNEKGEIIAEGGTMRYFLDGFMAYDAVAYRELVEKFYTNGTLDKVKLVSQPMSSIVEFMKYPVLTNSAKSLYYVLSDKFVDENFKERNKDSKVKFTPEYSEVEVTLKFTDQLFVNTEKYAAIVDKIEYVKPSTISKIAGETDELYSFRIVKAIPLEDNYNRMGTLIVDTGIVDYIEIYNNFLLNLWKVNNYPKVQEYFLNEIFLEYMFLNDMVSTPAIDDYKKSLEYKGFTIPTLSADFEFLNDLIKSCKTTKEDLSGNEQVVSEDKNKREMQSFIESLSTVNKISLLDDVISNNGVTKDMIYDSIKEGNSILENEGFRKSFYEVQNESFDDMIQAWSSENDSKDLLDLCDAIAILLRECGILTLDGTLDILSKDVKNRKILLSSEYERYINETSEIKTENFMQYDTQQEMEINENNIEDIYSGFKELLESSIQEIESTPDKLMTPRSKKILDILKKELTLLKDEEEKVINND